MASSSRASSTTADDSCKRKRVDDASNGESDHTQQVDLDISFKRPKLAQTTRLLRNVNSNSNQQQQSNTTENSDDESDYEERERKKRKKGRSRNQGKLSVFMGLPLDVLAEITSYLLPLDILHLSRVSKNFRELFNPHASRHMWVAARLNVPSLPECPKDLNEAQYASLMFEHHCQACASPRAHIVNFGLRCRTCKPCYDELTRGGYYIVTAVSDASQLQEVVYTLAPFSTHKDNYGGPFEVHPHRRYNIAELTAVFQQYIKLEGNEELRKKFVQERQETSRMMMETGYAMERWLTLSRRDRREKNGDNANNRHAEICKRLLELGWTQKDIDDNKQSDMTKMMYQPRPLTTRIWKQIYPKMEKIIIDTRLISRRKEFKASWRLVVEKLVPAEQRIFIPNSFEALNLPCIAPLLSRNNAGNIVDEATIEEVMPQALKESEPHQMMVKRYLLKVIYKAIAKPQPDGQQPVLPDDDQISPDDPTLFYACHRFVCGQCFKYSYGDRKPTFNVVELYGHLTKSHTGSLDCLSWADFRVSYASSTAQITSEILHAVGLAKDARQQEVMSFEGKLACACGNPSIKGKRFGLLSLTSHILDENAFHEKVISNLSKDSKKLDEEEMEIYDDHTLSDIRRLVTMIPNDETPEQGQGTSSVLYPPDTKGPSFERVKCVPCCVLTPRYSGIKHVMASHEEVEYHLNAKHRLEFKEQYVSTKLYSYDW